MTNYKWKAGDQNIVANLRQKWPEELKRFGDYELAEEYNDFSMSDHYGNNDERFLEWVFMTDG